MKILVADKDTALLSLIHTRLTSRHYEVVEAQTSQDVLHCLNQDRYDLALLSTNLERVSGHHLVQKIRQQAHLSALPILMMTSEDDIAELLLGHERGFDDFLIKPFSTLSLQLRVSLNLHRIRARAEANALTQLPGNGAIEAILRSKIELQEPFSVLYIDINHFKSFNDRYGFAKGDDAIKQTSKILTQVKNRVCEDRDCFVGHIGGDDFIVVLEEMDEEAYAREFISEFDRIMATYYSDEDQERGFIEVNNRRGEKEQFPLMSCCVAACTNVYRPYESVGEISRDASQLKSFLKSQPGSNYLRDRRSAPISKLSEAKTVIEKSKKETAMGTASLPLGKLLLRQGLIDENQLSDALKKHIGSGQRLGQTLVAMNLVKSSDLGRILSEKQGVPYVELEQTEIGDKMLDVFPFEFLKMRRILPIEKHDDVMKLAMCDPTDRKTREIVEQSLGVQVNPCLMLENEFESFMEVHREESSERYVV